MHQSIGCESIFQDGGRPAIFDLFGAYLDHPQRVLGVSITAKYGYGQCSSIDNMKISIFGIFGWKMLIYALKIGVLGLFDLLNG